MDSVHEMRSSVTLTTPFHTIQSKVVYFLNHNDPFCGEQLPIMSTLETHSTVYTTYSPTDLSTKFLDFPICSLLISWVDRAGVSWGYVLKVR